MLAGLIKFPFYMSNRALHHDQEYERLAGLPIV